MLPEGLGMNLIKSPRYSREVKIVTENKTVTEIIMKAFHQEQHPGQYPQLSTLQRTSSSLSLSCDSPDRQNPSEEVEARY